MNDQNNNTQGVNVPVMDVPSQSAPSPSHTAQVMPTQVSHQVQNIQINQVVEKPVQSQVVQQSVQNTQQVHYQKPSSDELIVSFIGPNFDKLIKRPFNFPALLFTSLYYFYRKMNLYGIIILLIQCSLLYFFPERLYLLVIINFICALITNKIYLGFCARKISRIISKNSSRNIDEIRGVCSVVGGVSVLRVVVAIIWTMLLAIPVSIVLFILSYSSSLEEILKEYNIEIPNITIPDISLPDISIDNNKYNGYLVNDKEVVILDNFKINTPSNFKKTKENSKNILSYSYKSNKKTLGTCSYTFRAISGYSSPRKLMEDMHEYHKEEKISDVKETKVNKINWYNFTIESNEALTYYYACSKERTVYLYIFIDQKETANICHTYPSQILHSIVSK